MMNDDLNQDFPLSTQLYLATCITAGDTEVLGGWINCGLQRNSLST